MPTFCSIIKLCINKDNPHVPLLSTIRIMSDKGENWKNCLSGLNSRMVGFYQASGFLFTPVTVQIFPHSFDTSHPTNSRWSWHAIYIGWSFLTVPP